MAGLRNEQQYNNQSNDSTAGGGEKSTSSTGSGGSSRSRKTPKTIVSWNDKKKLMKYLQDYKAGAERVRLGIFTNNTNTQNDDQDDSSNGNNSSNSNTEKQEDSDDGSDDAFVVIGANNFTALTDIVLSKPYVELPKTLSGKDRRFVHEICTDVGLYHCGIGNNDRNRCVVVSIYSDGFSYLGDSDKDESSSSESSTESSSLMLSPKMQKEMDDTLFYRCKPWFCQTENSVVLITRQFKKNIKKLINDPEDCIRDDHDTLDYKALENQDLSGIPRPTTSTSDNKDDTDDWMLVDTAEKMQQCIQELTELEPTEIAFGLEAQKVNMYTQRTCLLHIASSSSETSTSDIGDSIHKEYIIDPLAPGVWDEISGLQPLFANPEIVKIGHSIGTLDIRSLHRDFGIFVVNVFDTYEAAIELGLPHHHGLNDVCQYYGMDVSTYESYSELKASHHSTDWRIRPLTQGMMDYARSNIHYLFALRILMMRDLTRKELYDDVEQEEEDDAIAEAEELRENENLMHVITTSLERSKDSLWSSKPESQMIAQFKATLQQHLTNWTPSQMALYEELVEFRTTISTQERSLPGFVCTLEFLVHVATKRPTNVEALQKISYFLPDFFLHGGKNNSNNKGEEKAGVGYLEHLLDLVQTSREQDKNNNDDQQQEEGEGENNNNNEQDEYNITYVYDGAIQAKVNENNANANANAETQETAAAAAAAPVDTVSVDTAEVQAAPVEPATAEIATAEIATAETTAEAASAEIATAETTAETATAETTTETATAETAAETATAGSASAETVIVETAKADTATVDTASASTASASTTTGDAAPVDTASADTASAVSVPAETVRELAPAHPSTAPVETELSSTLTASDMKATEVMSHPITFTGTLRSASTSFNPSRLDSTCTYVTAQGSITDYTDHDDFTESSDVAERLPQILSESNLANLVGTEPADTVSTKTAPADAAAADTVPADAAAADTVPADASAAVADTVPADASAAVADTVQADASAAVVDTVPADAAAARTVPADKKPVGTTLVDQATTADTAAAAASTIAASTAAARSVAAPAASATTSPSVNSNTNTTKTKPSVPSRNKESDTVEPPVPERGSSWKKVSAVVGLVALGAATTLLIVTLGKRRMRKG